LADLADLVLAYDFEDFWTLGKMSAQTMGSTCNDDGDDVDDIDAMAAAQHAATMTVLRSAARRRLFLVLLIIIWGLGSAAVYFM
jgi:hypothetical protein